MRALVAVFALLLGGCSTVQYYGQAISGHMSLMQRAQPVEELVDNRQLPPALEAKLRRAQDIRAFASEKLGLPDNGSYRSYADLGRPFAVWNVFTAPELSIEPRQSCFLFVGCVTYRGYYDPSDAGAFAEELKAQGFDTYIGGVPAYSTLGFFDDPLLNTFINYPEAELARLIFHELAHQVVYVKHDTTFNESFAVAVEREGLRRWLEQRGSESDRKAYEAYAQRREGFLDLVMRYRERLGALYRSPVAVEEKRAAKQAAFAQMNADYQALKAEWGGFSGYDRFFAGANNATLASLAVYNQWVPAFNALLEREGRDLPRFYTAVRELARLDRAERDTRLKELMR